MLKLANTMTPAPEKSGFLLLSCRSYLPRLVRFLLGSILAVDSAIAGEVLYGIDVSHYQTHPIAGGPLVPVDWTAVKSATPNRVFAFIKSSEAVGVADNDFKQSIDSGHAAEIAVGPYHLGRPDLNPGTDMAKMEAQYFISIVGSYLKAGYLRPALDIETDKTGDRTKLGMWIEAWMETVRAQILANTGQSVDPILYISRDVANSLPASMTKYPLWITDRHATETEVGNISPWSPSAWKFHQYWFGEAGGSCPGVNNGGACDLDVFNGSLSDLNSLVLAGNQSGSITFVSGANGAVVPNLPVKIDGITAGSTDSGGKTVRPAWLCGNHRIEAILGKLHFSGLLNFICGSSALSSPAAFNSAEIDANDENTYVVEMESDGSCSESSAVNNFNLGGVVEVFGTGNGLRARYPDPCSDAWKTMADGSRGTIVGASQCCNGYVRWKIRYDDMPTLEMWSAEREPSTGQLFLRSVSTGNAPASPSNLTARAVSTSQINLTWSDQSTNETSFVLERATGSGGPWNAAATLGISVQAYSDTGRSPGTTYYYRVKAVNASGASGYSNPASATTQQPNATAVLTVASSNPSSGVSVSTFVGSSSYQSALTPTSRSFSVGAVVGATCPQTLTNGKYFQKWQLDGSDFSFETYATLTMDSAHTLTAVYGTSPPPNRTLTNLVVEGQSSVSENSSSQYKALATFSDGSSTYVTPTWSEDSSYATISSNGLLDAGEVTSDRLIHVIASFSFAGTTITYSKDVTIRNTNTSASYTLTINSTAGGSVGHSPSGSSYAAGTVVSLHGNADGSYIFSHWSGDASGTDDDITVVMDRNRSVTANFVLDPSEGALRVNLFPAQAVSEGAQWRFDTFTAWRDSGNTQTNISPRSNRYLHFKPIPGWIAPDEIKTSIVGTQTTVVSATYREILGTVQITITPPEAVAAGARWRLDGGEWRESGAAVNGVAPGNRTIEFRSIPGWQPPSSQILAVTRGNVSLAVGSYGPPAGQLLLTGISPSSGPIEGGIPITIDGVNFAPGAGITFGGISATGVTVLSTSRITAILPARATYGSVTVAVSSNGQTASKPNGFTYDIALGMNMTLLSQIGGRIKAVAVSGTAVVYGEGNSVVYADFTNLSAPVVRGRLALPGLVKDIQIVGNHALIANAGSGLQIVDISNPTALGKVGFYDTPGTASRLAINGNLAYLADGSGGLQILDFTDRTAPRRVGGFAGSVLDVGFSVIGGRNIVCAVTYPNGLAVLDVTDPTAIQQLSTVESTVPLRTLTLDGQTLVVTGRLADNPTNADGKVYSLANPSLPVKIREGFGSFDDVGVISGSTYYRGDSFLEIYNLNNNPPSRIGFLDIAGTTSGLVLSGTTLFAANGDAGLIAIDVANASFPSIKSTINNGFGAGDVTVSNNTAYVAFGGDSSSSGSTAFPVLTAFNVTDPRNPQRGGTASFTSTIETLLLSNGSLLGTTQQNGIPSFSLQNALAPTFNSARLTDRYTYGAAKLGSNLILAGGTKGSGPSFPLLTVLDGTNTSNSAPLSTFQLSTSVGVGRAVVANGTTVFVFIDDVGMRVVDYSNLASPRIIGGVDFLGFGGHAALSVDGRYVYATDFANGLRIIDCANPAAPVLRNTYTRNGETYAKSVVVQGNLIFYADNRGLNVLDGSNPENPIVVAAYDTPGNPYGMFVDGKRVFVADASGGVQILELGDLSLPLVEITIPTRNSLYETAAATVDLAGTASDTEGIARVTWANSRGGGGTAAGTTSWSVTGIRLLSGDNDITVAVEDTSANVATDTITVRANLPDTAPPVISITGPNLDNQYEVSSANITLSGTAVDGGTIIDLSWSNSRGGSGVISANGNWSLNIQLFEGPNIITLTAHDAAGNVATTSQTIFYAPTDEAPPVITIDFPTIDAVYTTEQATVNLSGATSDNREVSQMRWQNDRGGSGTVAGFADWWVNDIPIQMGNNVITITATDAAGNSASDTLVVNRVASATPIPFFPVQLGNISTRLRVGTGDNAMIGGFIVTGIQPKTVIARGLGPSLAVFGIQGTLADPVIELHGPSGELLSTNDNWKDGIGSQQVLNSGLAPANDSESALWTTINPGNYTVVVGGKDNATGVGLFDVYDLDRSVDSKLANISTRGFVDTGNNVMIGGTIVLGTNPAQVVFRAIGPTLANFGLNNVLQDPVLELRDGNGVLLEANDNWRDSPNMQAIIDINLPPSDDRESAILATLSPGQYTAILMGKNDSTGVALVEAYQLQ